MKLSIQVEIRPTPSQRRALMQHAGNARWAYNWGLRKHKEAYERWDVAVPATYTSQRCSACGHVDAGNRTTQADFTCLSCGFQINADWNAAINILRAASSSDLIKNACGEDVRPNRVRPERQTSMKQEPGIQACLESDRGIGIGFKQRTAQPNLT